MKLRLCKMNLQLHVVVVFLKDISMATPITLRKSSMVLSLDNRNLS